ncbi:MAG: DUF3187 family protein [Leptospiraceae bacterium]|nr:DUF3187 family protein [Leptospiraceae bacterium]
MDYPYGVGFQIIHTPLLPLDNVNPGEGRFSVRTSMRGINVWSIQTNRYITDGEEGQLEPSVRYALTNKLQIGMSIPFSGRGGGFMDNSIEIFHRSVGVTQGQRDRYPQNRFNTSYEPLSQYYPLFDNDPFTAYFARNYDRREYPRKEYDQPLTLSLSTDKIRKLFVNKFFPYLNEYKTEDIAAANYDAIAGGNPKAHLQFTLWEGNSFINRITAGSQIKIPVKTVELIATPGTDISTFAVFHKKAVKGKLDMKLGISYSYFQIHQYRNLSLRGNLWVFRPSLVYNFSPWQFHFEYVYYPSPILNWGRLSVPTHQIGLGISKKFENYLCQFGIFENIITYSNTPDFVILVSLEKFALN